MNDNIFNLIVSTAFKENKKPVRTARKNKNLFKKENMLLGYTVNDSFMGIIK